MVVVGGTADEVLAKRGAEMDWRIGRGREERRLVARDLEESIVG